MLRPRLERGLPGIALSTDLNDKKLSADAAESAERSREADRRREVTEGLRDLIAVVNSGRPLQEILDAVTSQGNRAIGSDASTILLPAVDNPRLLRSRSTTRDLSSLAVPRPVERTGVGLSFLLRRPVVISDGPAVYGPAEDPDAQPRYDDHGTYVRITYLPEPEDAVQRQAMFNFMDSFQSLLAMPLVSGDEALGVLTFIYFEARPFSDEEVALAAAFADQAALAIQNARLHDEALRATAREEKQRQVAEALRDLLGVVNSGRPLQEILEAVAAQASRLIGSDASSIVLPSEEPDSLMTQATTEPDPEMPALPSSPRVAALAFRLRRPAAIHDIPAVYGHSPDGDTTPAYEDRGSHLKVTLISWPTDPDQLARSRRFVENYGAFLAAPLLSGDETLGVLTFLYRSPKEFSDEDLSLATAFADQATLAIQNARLHEQALNAAAREEKQRQVAEGLRDLLAVVNSGRPLPEILDAIVAQASRLLGSHASSILLPERGTTEFLATSATIALSLDGTSEEDGPRVRLKIDASAAGLALTSRRPVAVHDIRPMSRQASDAVAFVDRGPYLLVTGLPEPGDPEHQASRATVSRDFRAALAVPLASRLDAYGVLWLLYREPREFSEEEVSLASAFADQTALAIENASLHEREGDRAREIERRRVVAEGLRDLLAVVNSGRPSQEILEAIVHQASLLVGSDASSILLPAMEEQTVLRTQASTEANDDMMATLPVSRSAAGLAFLLRRPTAVYDIRGVYGTEDAPPRYEDQGSHVRVTFLPEQTDTSEREKATRFAIAYKSFLGVPLTSADEPLGVLTFLYREGRQFRDEDVELAVALADQAALALQNARLHEQAQHAATLEERQRLARDLHDAVTQTLFSTALIAEVIPDLWGLDEEEGRLRLADLRRLTRGALAEMRTLLVELRPGALTEMPLGDLLTQLAEAISGRTKIAVRASVTGQPRRLPDEVQIALYRIAQESINNVIKHARATKALIEIEWRSAGEVVLSVTDDGAGFDPEAIPSGHLGVGIMKERAAAIGGAMTIDSKPGETTVRVVWQAEEIEE